MPEQRFSESELAVIRRAFALYNAFERGGYEFIKSLRWNEPTDPLRCWYWTPRWSLSYDDVTSS